MIKTALHMLACAFLCAVFALAADPPPAHLSTKCCTGIQYRKSSAPLPGT